MHTKVDIADRILAAPVRLLADGGFRREPQPIPTFLKSKRGVQIWWRASSERTIVLPGAGAIDRIQRESRSTRHGEHYQEISRSQALTSRFTPPSDKSDTFHLQSP